MTATRRPLTRGPLPARVYWRRRLLVLGVALLLVLGLGRLLGGSSDGSSDADEDRGSARLSGASASSPDDAAPSSSGTPERDRPRKPRTKPAAPTSTAPVLAVPDGPCVDSDIAVTPSVTEAVAGPRHGVVIALELRTLTDDACTWKVSPRSLTLKVTSGADDIWSTRECPRAVPVQDVTVRRAVPTTLTLEWNARRSDEDCSRLTAWAMPGWYHVSAAALGGEPADVQFELVAPTPEEITVAPEPGEDGKKNKKDKAEKHDEKDRDDRDDREEKQSPGAEPSGAVEPDQT